MDILEEIYQHKLLEVRNKKKIKNLQEICKDIKCLNNSSHNFIQAIINKKTQKKNALICEVKKASPSKGIIRNDFNHIDIAMRYQEAGACCISVLTDEKFFKGSDSYLKDIKLQTSIPILRKDFIVDEYQIYEAKMLGADCILLIIAMLNDQKLSDLERCASSLNLSVLLEIHDLQDLQRAINLKSKLIGINNRNLRTFEVNINNTINLTKYIPKDYIIVSESGINSIDDIKKLNDVGISCFLIGEHFMRQKNIDKAVKEFL